jgi:thymidylate kinase
MIIIEGPDKCGKSTFIKNAGIPEVEASETMLPQTPTAIHSTADDDSFTVLTKAMAWEDMGYEIYLDRCWISEVIYGKIYRNTDFDPVEENKIINLLKARHTVILYFNRPFYEVLTSLDENDFYENDIQKMGQVHSMYEEYMSKLAEHLPVYKVQW